MKKCMITLCLLAATCAQAQTTNTNWADWLIKTSQHHPQLQNLQFQVTAAKYRASGMTKPIFNPALETEIEKEGEAFNYRIGLATDIDWWNQQDIRAKLGNKQLALVQFNLQNATNSVLSDAIKAQIAYDLSEKNYVLAKAQVEQDLKLLTLVKAEVDAGEANLTDIAILNAILGENIVAENHALIVYLEAENRVNTLLRRQLSLPDIPQQFWQISINLPDDKTLQQLPSMQVAYYQWQLAKQEVELVIAATKPSPAVSMNIGEQDGTATVAMSLSVPLTFRNNYQDETDEARQLALAAEQQFRSDMQTMQSTMRQQVQSVTLLKQRFEQWQTASANSFETQSNILHKRFSSGDLSIADYQGLVQQLRSGMQASLSIEEIFKLNYVDYLATSGQLLTLLQNLATQEIKP
jgi:outer membrane protein, heavy metal efflux system